MITGFDLAEYEELIASAGAAFADQRVGKLRARTMLLLLWWIWQMPLASAKNLSDIGFFPVAKVHRLLQDLASQGYIGQLEIGLGYRRQARSFLHRKGVNFVNSAFGRTPQYDWQVTEDALRRFIRRPRMMEAIYDVATRTLRSSAVDTPAFFEPTPEGISEELMNAHMRLVRFTWLRSGPVHAIAEYREHSRFGRNLSFFPLFGTDCTMGRTLYPLTISESLYAGLKTMHPTLLWYGVPASPGGLVIVAIDRLAAFRARTQLPPYLPTAIVDASGNLIKTLTPMRPYGALIETTVLPGPLGVPENLGRVVQNDEKLAAVCGVPKNAAFEWIENWPGQPDPRRWPGGSGSRAAL